MLLEGLIQQIGQGRIFVGIDLVFDIGGVTLKPKFVHVLLLGMQALSPF